MTVCEKHVLCHGTDACPACLLELELAEAKDRLKAAIESMTQLSGLAKTAHERLARG